jgi:hypothetical protein
MKRDELTGVRVHRDPDPWLVGLLLHNAPHRIGFGCQLPNDHVWWPSRPLDVSVIGAGRTALDHTVHDPREPDAHRPTDPAQGKALAEQVLHQRALFISHDAVFGSSPTLASVGLALVVLRAAGNMAAVSANRLYGCGRIMVQHAEDRERVADLTSEVC